MKPSWVKRAARNIAVMLAIGTPIVGLVFALYLLGVLPIADLSPRPAGAYESTEELAAALNRGGVPCDFRQQKIGRGSDPGFCRDSEEEAEMGISLSTFGDEEETRQRIRDFEICGLADGIAGPNWLVIVRGKSEAEAVLEAVGGRVVDGGAC